MPTNQIRELNRRAVLRCVEVVSLVGSGDLDRPTPCSEWRLGELLAHMTVQHMGFAASAQGGGAEFDWKPSPLGADPAGDYAVAARHALEVFDEDGVESRAFTLPEISPTLTFRGSLAIGFHFIDAVVHGWDVARSLGLPYELEPELADDAVRIALAVPQGEHRSRPGAAFAPALPTPEPASALDTVLTVLGRSPNWPD